ncbi:MAG TPA: hypothetical protein VIK84_07290 [Haloplasmataceae bacterium]
MTLREVLDPYLPLLTIIVTLAVNYQMFKRGANWYGIVGVNLILLIISGLLGVKAYEFIPQLVNELMDMIRLVWKETIGSIFDRGENDTTTSINIFNNIKLWKAIL